MILVAAPSVKTCLYNFLCLVSLLIDAVPYYTRSVAAAIVYLTLALNNLVDETRTSIVPFKMSNHQKLSQAKFAWTCLILQICFGILFVLLVRYSESADATHEENQKGLDHDLKENLEKYPAILDGKLNFNNHRIKYFDSEMQI